MSRVIAFGCSLTYGDGLSDCSVIKNGKYLCHGNKPSRYSWPNLVAKKLGVDCENHAAPGSSNKQIALTILGCSFEENDTVLINWSFVERYCIVDLNHHYKQISPSIKNNFSTYYTKFHLKFGNNYNSMIDSLLQITAADSHLKKFTKNVYHYLTDDSQYNDLPAWFKVDITGKSFKTLYSKSLGLDNSHPGHDGHKAFAKVVLKNIKENRHD